MPIWTQILSWTLICSLGQGFVVYSSLWLILKLVPGSTAATKYKLSLSAMAVTLLWFCATLLRQLEAAVVLQEQSTGSTGTIAGPIPLTAIAGKITGLQITPVVPPFLSWLAVAYITGLVFMLVRLSSGLQQLVLIRRNGLAEPTESLGQLLDSLQAKLQLRGKVQLFISARSQVPMVIGFIKPAILLPAATMMQLSTEQLETILLHELAHIKRHDFLVNILQTIAETILFFNPFVWMTSAIVRREREYCCDDLVLAHTPEPVSYARALTALASPDRYNVSLAVAATGRPQHLLQRVRRIMELKKNPFSYSRTTAAILTITLIVFTASLVSHSFAMIKKDIVETPLSINSAGNKKPMNDENLRLIAQLSNDHLIDEAKGFIIEKKDGKLFIDNKALPDARAAQYLAPITKKELRIQVYPLQERIRRHPGSSLLQLAAPVQLSAPCVDYSTPKEGC
jgi:bla regulator protein BlaR1